MGGSDVVNIGLIQLSLSGLVGFEHVARAWHRLGGCGITSLSCIEDSMYIT